MNPLYSIKNDDPRVKQAVDHIVTLQENYPLTVTYDEVPSFGLTFPGWVSYLVTFSHGESLIHTAIAGELAFYPQISINAMFAQGLLSKKA